jgi:hypothetical protein
MFHQYSETLYLNQMTLQIDILNPKAKRLLKELADLNLISIRDEHESNFMKVVTKLRKKASSESPTLEIITKEVELVRTKRYAKKKG